MNPLDYILQLVDDATATYILDAFSNIADSLDGTFRNLLILFFILYGIGIWRGTIKSDAMEFSWNVIKVSVVYSFVFTWPIYSPVIVELFTNGPDTLAGIVIGSPSGSITDVVGDAYAGTIAAADRAFDKSGIFMPALLGSIILISGTILIVFVTFLLCIAKIALSVLIGIGGLAFLMLMFKSTQKMFEAWLQQCINFFLYVVLTIGVMTIGGELFRRSVAAIPDEPGLIDLASVVPLLMIGFTISLILKQVPALASAIAGGVQISSLGAEGAPGRYMSGVYNRWQMRRAFGGSGTSRRPRLGGLLGRKNSIRNR